MSKIDISSYSVTCASLDRPIKLAVLADLHSRADTDIEPIICAVQEYLPDYILMPGDIFERLDGTNPQNKERGFEFLERCAAIAPVIYSIGNHENGGIRSWNKLKWQRIKCIPKYYDSAEIARIEKSAVLLDDGYRVIDGIAFGGLTSGLINEGQIPNAAWLDEFCALDAPKILLCHHPEYYNKYVRSMGIDLCVSGHAHGGQWRFFGRGVFAPGQGIFPKYTSGLHDGHFVISRGLKESRTIPRIFNSPELVFVSVN